MFFQKKPMLLTFAMLFMPQVAFSANHNDTHNDIHNEIIDIPKISGSIVIDANLRTTMEVCKKSTD